MSEVMSIATPESRRAEEPDANSEVILMVCTANVTRSPSAEYMLRQRLSETPTNQVRISSAGTAAVVGEAIDPRMAELLSGKGLGTSMHRSRRVTREDLLAATLILAMGTDHRAQVATLAPEARTKTFTLLEFSRLAEMMVQRGPSSTDLEGIVAEAARLRSSMTGRPAGDTVKDPRGRSRWAYRRTVRLLTEALGPVATLVGGARPST